MKVFAAGGLCALALVFMAAAPAAAVVGGRPVPPGQFPYVANVRVGGSFGCSGTLIAPQWVLTAGHCGSVTGSLSTGLVASPAAWPADAYEVILGTPYADGRGGEDHTVTQVVVDSDYFVTNGSGNDVTLMKLDAPSKIQPMKIAATGERDSWRPGVLATIAGFGTTSDDATAEPPDQEQWARVPITTDEYCAKAYPGGLGTVADDGAFDPKTMLCAGYPQGGTDTCEGDSGGPLMVRESDGSLRLVGATSYGNGCAKPGKPGVYARLADGPIRAFIASVVPDAFAPEPKHAKGHVREARRISRRCAPRRRHGHGRDRRARARCGRHRSSRR